MKILFITATRIGDAILSTGLLNYMVAAYPQSRITVACGPLCDGFFRACPNVDEVIVLKKQSFSRHWLDLWKKVVRTRWDIVVDLRNSAVSRAVFAHKRFIFGPHIDENLHKVQQNAAVMRIAPPPAPRLWFDAPALKEAEARIPSGGPVLAVGPAANWHAKTWPADRFIELVARLTGPDGILPGARVAVIAAPGEEAAARPVLESIPEDRRIDLIGALSPLTAAACIARCSLYVGNDSGLMHAAAAAGVPTIGLFGPSWPHIYGPWGDHASFVRTPKTFSELTDYPGYTPQTAPNLMEGLSVDTAAAHIEGFWRGRGLHKKA